VALDIMKELELYNALWTLYTGSCDDHIDHTSFTSHGTASIRTYSCVDGITSREDPESGGSPV